MLLYPPKEHISLMISLISEKSAFYETSTYGNCAKINSARKYEFGQCAKINGAKIGGARKKMGLRYIYIYIYSQVKTDLDLLLLHAVTSVRQTKLNLKTHRHLKTDSTIF